MMAHKKFNDQFIHRYPLAITPPITFLYDVKNVHKKIHEKCQSSRITKEVETMWRSSVARDFLFLCFFFIDTSWLEFLFESKNIADR